MEEKKIIELMKRMAKYLLGQLHQEEIDQLWQDFIKFPMLFEYVEIEAGIRKLGSIYSNEYKVQR